MRKERNAALLAVLAFAAAAPLAIYPYAASADELSDLRANQEFLQRRLDQLSQIPGPGGVYGGGPVNPAASAPSLGGSFPRSFLIPGTDTSIRIGGEIREVMDYWFSGGPPNASPQTTTLGDNGVALSAPLHVHSALNAASPSGIGLAGNPTRSRGTAIFSQSPTESKINFETRTPTAWGEARTFMEWDWGGSTTFLARRRQPNLGVRQPGPALALCLRYVRRVARRSGQLELLRS